jgi:hypothetical protein
MDATKHYMDLIREMTSAKRGEYLQLYKEILKPNGYTDKNFASQVARELGKISIYHVSEREGTTPDDYGIKMI